MKNKWGGYCIYGQKELYFWTAMTWQWRVPFGLDVGDKTSSKS
jgi:hypothetical protein